MKQDSTLNVTNLRNYYGTKVVNASPTTTNIRPMFLTLKQLVFKHKLKRGKIFNYHLTKGQIRNIRKIKNDKYVRYKIRMNKRYLNSLK